MDELDEISKLMIERKKEITEYMAIWSKVGSLDTALSKMLRGLNIVPQTKPYKARNRFKKMFFTRPMLNLSTPNLIMDRRLATLMSKREESIERYVRCALDPRQEYGEGNFYVYGSGGAVPAGSKEPRKSTFIDKYQPFIPIVSNSLSKASGFPDTVLNTYKSTPGMLKEVVGWTNSTSVYYGSWDLDTTFYNTVQEPIKMFFNTWITYQAKVAKGILYPYYDLMLGRKIDYTSAIFELVLDEDNRTINHVAQTIAHPITKPDGKEYDIDDSANYSAEDTDITMRWTCYGALYDDPMSLLDFNRHVSTFNPKLRPYADGNLDSGIQKDYVELTPDLYPRFTNLAIPFIDLRYKKLEWLVSKEDLEIVKTGLKEL